MPPNAETEALLIQVANAAARKAVSETFLTLGIDTHDPLETQRDMAALRELRDMVEDKEFQADLIHVRRWRKAMDSVEKRSVIAFLFFTFVGGLALTLFAFKQKLFGV